MATRKRLLIVGATGDVGWGIAAAATARGWQVAAAGRSRAKLDRLRAEFSGIVPIAGDVDALASAVALVERAREGLGDVDAIVVSVNAPVRMHPLFDNDEGSLVDLFRSNVVLHFHAAKAALDAMRPDGVLLGIGGGMADWVPRNGAHQSMVQAGLRNFYRGLAKEFPDRVIRQMQIVSMVNGRSKRAIAQQSWLTDVECGEHACAILDDPVAFKGPIITLKDRENVGRPEV